MQLDQVLGIILGTSIGARLGALQKLYSRLDREQKAFTKELCIHCTDGCGKCCENYYPYITTAEAEYLAMGILFEEREEEVLKKLHSAQNDRKSCPLYRKDNPYHCSVYGVRPLICRLFGASATLYKNSKPVFRDCKWKDDKRQIATQELEKASNLVIMGEYGVQLDEIQIEDTENYPLDEALERAIYKIKFLLQLDDDPEPEPKAS